MTICYHCSADTDTRPYGPKCEPVCFDCACAPDHEAQTALSFALQLLACGDEALLSVHGPIPLPGKRWN